ncbi:MAG TPA: hypothetical protein PK867_30690, partial [Pirellulales bacterium]|nr:hypothetical protein [Pirellulales bacterium]
MTGPSPRLISGKYALLAVVALGLAGAVGGWWYRQSLQRRPLALWGHEAASLMVRAHSVELCRLEQVTKVALSIAIKADGHAYQRVNCVDAARIRGFLHLRHSLLNDYS